MNQHKNIKQVFFLLILIFPVSLHLHAQKDFRPGYVITNEYDTIHGLIDYRGDIRNSKECVFKKDPDALPETFLPFDIKGYRFSGSKFYLSKMIPVKDGKKALFVEYLVNGIANLYYYRDVNEDHYFIEKDDGVLYELTNNVRILQTPDGKEYMQESKKYIGIMKMVFRDCPSIFPEINKAGFNDRSFIKVAVDYHNKVCEGEKCIVYKKQLPRVRFTIGPFLGYQLTRLHIKEGGTKFFSLMDFSMGQSVLPGISMYLSMPRINDKLSFNVRANYLKAFFYSDYSSTTAIYYETTIDFSSAILSVSFTYTYPVGKYRPILSLGLSSNVMLHRSTDIVKESVWNNVVRTEEYSINPLGDFYLGPYAEAGVTRKIFKKFPVFFSLSYGYLFVTNPISYGLTQIRPSLSFLTFNTGIFL